MENDGIVLKTEMRQIEDERVAERTQYQVMVQSAREEWNEFNQQYNHVIGCWREARNQEDPNQSFNPRPCCSMKRETVCYPGRLRGSYSIQELEITLSRERERFVSTTGRRFRKRQEFNELRDKADRIRLEASEALAAKDNQRFHEGELISDEAMRLKQRNDLLVNEFNVAQQDVIKAGQIIHNEQ